MSNVTARIVLAGFVAADKEEDNRLPETMAVEAIISHLSDRINKYKKRRTRTAGSKSDDQAVTLDALDQHITTLEGQRAKMRALKDPERKVPRGGANL